MPDDQQDELARLRAATDLALDGEVLAVGPWRRFEVGGEADE